MVINIMILKQSCYRCGKILTLSWSQKHKISKILKISKVFKTLKIIKNINRYSSPPIDHIELAAETDSNSSVRIASHLSKEYFRDNQHICMYIKYLFYLSYIVYNISYIPYPLYILYISRWYFLVLTDLNLHGSNHTTKKTNPARTTSHHRLGLGGCVVICLITKLACLHCLVWTWRSYQQCFALAENFRRDLDTTDRSGATHHVPNRRCFDLKKLKVWPWLQYKKVGYCSNVFFSFSSDF